MPFILDELEEGNTTLEPALEKLMEGNKISISTNDYKKWAKDNKSKFENLRDMVKSKQ